jgi:hypothetical protein
MGLTPKLCALFVIASRLGEAKAASRRALNQERKMAKLVCEQITAHGDSCGRAAVYRIEGKCLCPSHGAAAGFRVWLQENPDAVCAEAYGSMSKVQLIALVKKLQGK